MLSSQKVQIVATRGGFELMFEEPQSAPQDLAISYRTESSRLGLSFVPFKPAGVNEDGYFLLLASPQELTTAADIVHKDVIFVFDTSGSMEQEHKIEQARAALERCLHSLNAEDRFGIVAFSDSVHPFRSKLLPATADNVALGADFADSMRASGGTDIHSALNRALEMLNDPERPHVIVFLTDGVATSGITSNPTIAHNIREKAGSTRLFSFGVGSDVNRTFLEQLGNENRGSFAFVDQGQNIDEVVGGFYAKIARPVLSDLSFDFGDITTAQQYPDVLPDLYKGSQLVMVGRYRTNGDAKAKLVGTLNGQRHEIALDAKFPAEENDNAFVARLWAQKRIDYLLAQTRLHGEHEEARNEVIALSMRYQIVTSYTSLVAAKAADQVVAMVYPARVRPGDPEVAVRADATSRRVRITLPWGPAKDARWDAMRNLWVARFLVPAGTKDGSYPIHVEVTKADGGLSVLALNISIDTQAPVLVATAAPVHAGGLLQLHAQAAVGPGEIPLHLAQQSPVVALVEDGPRLSAGTFDEGLVRITNHQIETLKTDPRINDLTRDAKGQIVAATSRGLYEIDPAGNARQVDRTPFTSVAQWHGKTWLASKHGLSVREENGLWTRGPAQGVLADLPDALADCGDFLCIGASDGLWLFDGERPCATRR